jgi:pyruvate/2-oxoglutarate dehydrogenase complex dihydrolipoamide dehydrogenase (E3) component
MISCKYLIIGSGETGLLLAKKLLELKESVILVDEKEFGGGFLNKEELPKKILTKESEIFASSLKLFKDYPETFSVIRKYRQKINSKIELEVKKIRNKNLVSFEKNVGFKFIQGRAEFFSKSLVEVNSETERHLISFQECFITIGKTEKNLPKIQGLDKTTFLDQESAFLFKEVPSHLAILGCNKESLEAASIYSGLGVKVTIFEEKDSKKVLPELDRTAFNYILKTLSTRQVEFLFNNKIRELKKTAKQILIVDGEREEHKVSHVYISSTKEFSAENIKLEKIELKHDLKGIFATNAGKTSQRNIWVFGESNKSTKADYKFVPVYNYIAGEAKKKNKQSTLSKDIMSVLSGQKNSFDTNFLSINTFSPVSNVGHSEGSAVTTFGTYIKTKVYNHKDQEDFLKVVYKENSDKALGIVLAGIYAQKMEEFAIMAIQKGITKTYLEAYLETYYQV